MSPISKLQGNSLDSTSMTSPWFQRADSNSCLLGKGGNVETKEEQPRNNGAVLGQDLGGHVGCLVLQPGIEPAPPAVEGQCLNQ